MSEVEHNFLLVVRTAQHRYTGGKIIQPVIYFEALVKRTHTNGSKIFLGILRRIQSSQVGQHSLRAGNCSLRRILLNEDGFDFVVLRNDDVALRARCTKLGRGIVHQPERTGEGTLVVCHETDTCESMRVRTWDEDRWCCIPDLSLWEPNVPSMPCKSRIGQERRMRSGYATQRF